MKKPLRFTTALLLLSCLATAQSNSFIGNYSFGRIDDIEPVKDGYIILSGNYWARTDTNGAVISSKSYSGYFSNAHYLRDKGFLVTSLLSDSTFSLIRLDSAGGVVWVNHYKVPDTLQLNSLFVSVSRKPAGFWITGGANMYHGFMILTDTLGKVIYSRLISSDTSKANSTYWFSGVGPVVQGKDKAYYFTLNATYFEAGFTLALLKMDSALNLKWCKSTYADFPSQEGMTMIKNRLFIASATYDSYITFPMVTEIDTSGKALHSFEITTNAQAIHCIDTTKGSCIIVGGIGTNSGSAFAIKLDTALNTKWANEYKAENFSFPSFYSVRQTRSGFIMAGDCIVKTDTSGNTACNTSNVSPTPKAYNSDADIIPVLYPLPVKQAISSITVSNNTNDTISYVCGPLVVNNIAKPIQNILVYPNPAGSTLTIENNLSRHSVLYFHLYNALGQEVKSVALQDSYASVSLSDVSVGIYLYRLIDGQYKLVKTGKLVVEH